MYPTPTGTPQGGVASPILANMTLDGLENELKKHFNRNDKVHLIRYADDFVITGSNPEILEKSKGIVTSFLKPRGLNLAEEKTTITHITKGFDFLGVNIRKYGDILLTKPAKKNIRKFLKEIRGTIRKLATATQEDLIKRLNPMIRGWVNYHKHGASKKTFSKVNEQIWLAIWKWCKRRHPKKGKQWIKTRYFQVWENRHWVFATKDKTSKLWSLINAADTPIVRHTKIINEVNPYEPRWETYLEERESKRWAMNCKRKQLLTLWKRAKGRCPKCDQRITRETGWHLHHIIFRVNGGDDSSRNLVLLHPNCHMQEHHEKPILTCPGDSE